MQTNLFRSASSLLSKDRYYHGIGGGNSGKRGKHLKSGSHTSIQGKGSDSSSGKRKRKTDDPDDNKKGEAFLLDEDFKLMAAVSPPPSEVFCAKSVEHKLADMWYDRLTTWRCESLYERRLRNHYMSYFCVCLNQRELRGIFKEVPLEEITWVDFRDSVDASSCCQSKRVSNDTSWPLSTSLMQMQMHQQQQGPGGSCGLGPGGGCCGGAGGGGGGSAGACCSRRTGGGVNTAWPHEVNSRRKIPQRTTFNLSNKSRPKLVPKHLDDDVPTSSDVDHTSSTLCSAGHKEALMQSQTHPSPLPQPVRNSPPICHIAMDSRNDMVYLLEAIKCELRGDRQQLTDDYLELEIRRYRDFYSRHRRDDPDYDKVVNDVNTQRERVFMLLNMQNDLVKLLL